MAEFSRFGFAFFLPRLSVAFGAVFRSHRTVEANRLFVPLEFAHRRQQRPDPTVPQAKMTKAAGHRGFKLNPTLCNSIGLGGVFAIRNFPVRRLRIGEPRLQHVANLILAFHRLDVPGEGHKVAPVAVGLKEIDGVFHLASGQRLVERVEQIGYFSVRGFIEHDDVLPCADGESLRSFFVPAS